MGTTIEDIQYEMYLEDEYLEEIRQNAIEYSIGERLLCYYLEEVKSIEPVLQSIRNAEEHLEFCPTSTVIYSGVTQEYLLKNVLFKPLVFALVNNEIAAEIIVSYIFNRARSPFATQKINDIVYELTGINFYTYKRKNAKKCIWEEMKELSEKRNKALHEAAQFGDKDAKFALNLIQDLYSQKNTTRL